MKWRECPDCDCETVNEKGFCSYCGRETMESIDEVSAEKVMIPTAMTKGGLKKAWGDRCSNCSSVLSPDGYCVQCGGHDFVIGTA